MEFHGPGKLGCILHAFNCQATEYSGEMQCQYLLLKLGGRIKYSLDQREGE